MKLQMADVRTEFMKPLASDNEDDDDTIAIVRSVIMDAERLAGGAL